MNSSLTPIMSLKTLLAPYLNATQQNEIDSLTLTGMSLDSRNISDGMLFVALKGTQTHGVRFAPKAAALGAVAIIWEADEHITAPSLSIPILAIADLSAKLGAIAHHYFAYPSQNLCMVGITGTDGKTSISHFLAQAINAQTPNKCHVIGTLGIGTPDHLAQATHTTPDVITVHQTLQQQKSHHAEVVAMEVSSHALDQGRVNAVQFNTAVLSNLTRDHLDYHHTIAAYTAAKEKLFYWPNLENIVVNSDDAMGLRLAQERANSTVRVIAYGLYTPTTLPQGVELILAQEAQFDHRGIVANIVTPIGESQLIAPILGRFNLSNLLAVLGVLITQNYSLDEAIAQIAQVKTVAGRMQRISVNTAEKEEKRLVVVDYAHTPGALEQALLASREHTQQRLICVFGCGGDRDRGKRPLMAQKAEYLADRIIVTDDNPRYENAITIFKEIKQGFKTLDKVTFEHDRATAIRLAISEAQAGDMVLIAGKGHETVQIIKDAVIPFDDCQVAATILQETQQ